MDFQLKRGQQCVIRIGAGESEAVKIAVANLTVDLERTLGISAQVLQDNNGTDRKNGREQDEKQGSNGTAAEILVGTIGTSGTIEENAEFTALYDDASGRLRKEAYLHRVSDGRLVIAGSDRRGTVYGIYDLSEMLGVSPWYFWTDVPVREKQEFTLPEDYTKADYPSVEYRGIFINDEEELEAWVQNYMKEPTIGVRTYEKVFELLLRLKANYIWPAMHVNSFNLKQENGALADRMGIVVGTSHCDMLVRSNNREWKPWIQKKGYTDAVYDYSIEGRNREILKEYWQESVEQNRDFEVCYTLGMRGIHDSGFETKNLAGKSAEEIRAAKVELLEKIIADQREILYDSLGHETMTTFIPYKEVLELYDNGLEIPKDMTLVWANDNYGYIRRYPSEKEKTRRGGNGIYYHNSYWAPPSMSYVFLCSIPLAHTRNELQKAWNEGIRKLWVLNSGAMKPLEQEITFFLRLAWEIGKPGALTEDVDAFVEDWIDRTFTGKIGKRVAKLLGDFAQVTNVRKVENMDYDAFSQTAYGDEAVLRIHRYEEMFAEGNALYEKLPGEEKDAFFQLVLLRIHAAYFTNLAYYYGDRSTLMYDRGNMQAAALYTEKSREAEDARRRLLHYYNHVMCGGKWNGILNPEGFPPPRAAMMPVCTPPLKIEGKPSMRIDVWNDDKELCFMTPGEKWIDIGNMGTGEFAVHIEAPEWVTLSEKQTVVSGEKRIIVRVSDVSENRMGEILIKNICDDSVQAIPVRVVKTECAKLANAGLGCADLDSAKGTSSYCAVEEDGLIVLDRPMQGDCVMETKHELRTGDDNFCSVGLGDCSLDAAEMNAGMQKVGDFKVIRRLGRMQGDLIEACVQREPEELTGKGIKAKPLCYTFFTHSTGELLLEIHRFPSLNSVGRLRVGISLDGEPVQVVESVSNDEWRGNWKKNVLNNVDRLYLKLVIPVPADVAKEQQTGVQWNVAGEQRQNGVQWNAGQQQAGEQRHTEEQWNAGRQHTSEQNQAGLHQLRVWAIDKYFAFSRMVIYTEPRKENNLAGIKGAQALPKEQELAAWCDVFYARENVRNLTTLSHIPHAADSESISCPLAQEKQAGGYRLPPRSVFYAVHGNDRDSLTVTCREEQAECFGRTVTPDWYLEQGKRIFAEIDGTIRIDAASVLAQNKNAWTQDTGYTGQQRQTEQPEKAGQVRGLWRHCSSESYGRSGLAMYIRASLKNHSNSFTESIFPPCPETQEPCWTLETAPSLNYRIQCSGGTYTLWMLSKFNVREEGVFGIGIDGSQIPEENLYGNGSLWRYEAEQIYRWVPTAQIPLAEGEHTLHIYALASGMRYDRFYLTKGTEQPPMDTAW